MLDVLWDAARPLAVREMRDRLEVDRLLAYTTVQTVADRLTRKGLATRMPAGRAYRYAPTQRREDHVASIMVDALEDTPDHARVLTRFAQRIDRADAVHLLGALIATMEVEGE